MKKQSLGLKVSVIVAFMIALIIIFIVLIVSLQSSQLISEITAREADTANTFLAKELQNLQDEAMNYARIIAYSNDVVNAIQTGDEAALKQALIYYGGSLDTATITDAQGNVLSRKHNDQKGDNIYNQFVISTALTTGSGANQIARGSTVGMSTRASYAVKDYDGKIIGAVVVGHDLSNPIYVDTIKQYTGSEVTIFDGDTRLMTTLMNEQGARAIGTKADDNVVDTVLRRKQSYSSQLVIFGRTYYAHYSPLIIEGEAVGILFTGVNIDSALDGQRSMMIMVIVAGVIFGVVCVGALLIFNNYSVTKPLLRLKNLIADVVRGELNVNVNKSNVSKDEIGDLTLDTYKLIDIIKQLIDNLSRLIDEVGVKGEIDFRIDTSGFLGSFKLLADDMNRFTETFISDILKVLNNLTEISEGNFNIVIDKMPGKKVVLNEKFDLLLSCLNSIYKEIVGLAGGAVAGRLDMRADAGKYKAGWAELLNELNKLMDAVSEPAVEIGEVMDHISDGLFDLRMTGDYKGDFLKLKNSVNTTVTNIASYIEEISDVLRSMSQNDFTRTIKRDYVGSFTEIKDALNEIIETFNTILRNITSSSEQVAAGAKSISESSMTMATGASQQASAIEELNATVLSINENTSRNSVNAKNAEALSDHSKINAAAGDDDMKSMLTSMDGIKESSNSISKVIKVIEDIAFQTNLLALNAAVEAARAGAHGMGFAVVAEEVRSLASQSQAAAKETAAMIEESMRKVDDGTKIADKTAAALRVIVDDIGKVAEIITGIAISSKEQSEAITQVTEGLESITDVVQENSATSEETASASQELSSQADVLRNMVSVFKIMN